MSAAAVVATAYGLKAYGDYKANIDRAGAEERNAAFFEEQAQYIRDVGNRKLKLLGKEQEHYIQTQKAQYAKLGISFEGSALDLVVGSRMEAAEEQHALKAQTDKEVRLAMLKAQASRSAADAYKDPVNNFLQAGGSLLTGASRFV